MRPAIARTWFVGARVPRSRAATRGFRAEGARAAPPARWTALQAKLAITLDDAPSLLGGEGALDHDPSRMDRIREGLVGEGVRHCVAFVIGTSAEGHEPTLRRWLDAGFELGNHTFRHDRCSASPAERFLESVDLCDRLLESVGAFEDGRRRWFRFPYLDRGPDPAARSALLAALAERGYRSSEASLDSFDYFYDEHLAEAEREGDDERQSRIRGRFLRTALASARREARVSRRRHRRPVPQVFLAHFGPVVTREVGPVIRGLRDLGFEFCSLSEVVEDPVYADYDRDPERTGLNSADELDRSLPARVRRRVFRKLRRSPLFRQGTCGPLWPHLA